ncbi:hypothetical protein CDAR_199232 [Caerostris darwini]|uniref:protein-tyrosine-phosphatase n=1 Tax=Caerostris darwini TaxID=1538125 RepID=A0AAV4QMU5_9ARAC|nr:hypothetical protein CDAR_199232 [Caerostris darwini]
MAAVVLVCVFFLGLADTSVAQTTVTTLQNEESNATTTTPENETTIFPIQITTEENLLTTDFCEAPWNVTVTKNLDISWTGAKRDGTVFMNIVRELDETYDADCLQKTEFSEHFNEGQSPPLFKRPCHNSMYNISVELRCDNRIIHSFEQTVYTEPDVPSEITATQVTTTSFLVSWKPPPGPVEEYKVKVNSEELPATIPSLFKKDLTPESPYHVSVAARNKHEWSSWSKEISVLTKKLVNWYESDKNSSKTFNTTNTTTMLKGLTAFTEYHIQICAGTHGEIGSFSEVIAVRTSSGVPAEPNDLSADKVDSISIALKWMEPTPFRGPILYYTVNCISNDSSVAFQEETNETFYRIEDLMPLNSYSIRVSATTEAGTGRWAPQILVQTKRPLPPQNVRKVESNSNSITLQWDDPYVGKDIIKYYVVTSLRIGEKKRFRNTSELFITVHNLEPFTSYMFHVRAWSDNGASKWSEQLEVKTIIGIPLPPEKVYPRKVTNTSIEVMWKESPTFENLVIYHTIRWGAADLFREETSNRTYPPFLIRDLEPFTNYTIEVKSETKDGPGPWAEPIIVQTDVGIPFIPRNVTAYDVTNTTVMVKWDEPYPNRGPIEFYTIEWDEEDSATNVTTAFLSYFIDNLNPYQQYNIRVCAKTKEGFGDWSDPVTIVTSVGVPMAPKKVNITLTKVDSLKVRWEEPSPYRGNITWYTIRWTERDSTVSSNVVTTNKHYIIANLSAYTWYTIQVQASTEVGDGDWSDPVEGRTNIGIPSIPRNLTEKKSTSRTLEVEWAEPNPANGPIINYEIRWASRNSNATDNGQTKERKFAIKNLNPYTNYSIQVRAETRAGFGEWTEEIISQTDIGVPLVPRNITAYNVTNTSAMVEWDEPYPSTGPIELYAIEGRDEKSNIVFSATTNSSSYFVEDLSPYELYHIRVCAKTKEGFGNWSNRIEIVTLAGVPMAPRNVRIMVPTGGSLKIIWDAPRPFRGHITLYTIRWGERDPLEEKHLSSFDTSFSPSYTIGNLSGYTWYTIEVKASTQVGDGNWSDPVEGRTAIGIPSIPRNLTEKKTTNRTIEIEWEEPDRTNGPLTGYEIRWINLNNNGTKRGETKEKKYTIQNLSPYTNHSVQVRATTLVGVGDWTEEIIARTDIGIPHKPKEVKAVKVTNTSIELTWMEPIPSVGAIINYVVEWTDDEGQQMHMNANDLYCTIKNLSPYTNYSIKVRAETSAGLGKWGNSIVVRTLSGVPLAPTNIQKARVTNLTICINWKEPTPFKGPIVLYTVRWIHETSKLSMNGSTTTLSYCLKNLEPYTYYNIEVKAKTETAYGPCSEPRRIQTAVGIPTITRDLKEESKTAWSIHLTWSPPDPSHGPLQDYEVKWGKTGMMTKRNLTESMAFLVENLTPYTEYSFQVSASTSVGFGLPSAPLKVRTGVAIPSAPIDLEFISSTNVSLLVRWKSPRVPNGPISGYTVQWMKSFTENTNEIETESLQHEIVDLDPYANYSIWISAKTSAGSGPWTDALVAGTKIGVPKPAQILSVRSESSGSVTVEWSTISPYPGPTTYVLEAWEKPGPCEGSRGVIRHTTIEGSRGSGEWRFKREETVEGLVPYTEYYVRILLKTVVGESASANSTVIKTDPDTPGEPRQVMADCKESTQIKVRWKTPSRPNGQIIEYLVRYGIEYDGWSEKALLVGNECQENYHLILDDVRPERKYKIYVRAKAKGVEENGSEASIKGYCVLPAGIPPINDLKSLNIYGSSPTTLNIDWSTNVFSDGMGDIIHYAIFIGVSDAVGNASKGKDITEIFPSWSNYSVGSTHFYQATPLDWNPFNKGISEKVVPDPLQCKEIEGANNKFAIRCTVGVEEECSAEWFYCNGPLQPNTNYGVKLRAFTRGGFSETDPIFTYTNPIEGPSSVVGIVIGIIFVFLLASVFVIGAIVLRRKGKLDQLRYVILSRFGRQPTAPELPPEPVLQLEACSLVKPLNVQTFGDHVRLMMSDSHLKFSQEFEVIRQNSPKFPCSVAEMDENRSKNRWLNIFPYDHSRVKLLPLGDEPGSDFVNANYIPGYSSLREYIASQGPLANTVDDFWRMIWEQSVSMIVMLTQCVERGKNKCEQYWPDAGEAKHYGDMQVRTISESMLSSYTIRLYHVQLGSQERRVKQMHFTHWPDFGCPESPDDLMNFIRAVRDHLPRFKPGPILVHCSAGVGRTGTFIAVDRLSQQLHSSDSIDIFGTVMELRHHRINMVQTEDQYIYIHLCVKQLVDDINRPEEKGSEEAIYSNIGMEKDTNV